MTGVGRSDRRRVLAAATVLGLALAAGCTSSGPAPAPSTPATSTSTAAAPGYRWHHVVVVIMGSRSYEQVLGSGDAPFLSLLARSGVSFVNAHAVSRVAQPNYLALFSGSTQSVTTDRCPLHLHAANLASQLAAAGLTFTSYSQSLPRAGYRGCRTDPYVTAHNPAVAFVGVPDADNQRLGAFPTTLTRLPTVSFVIPDTGNSMAESAVTAGDNWVRSQLVSVAAWVTSHHSLLVITWDRSSADSPTNRIPMIALGAGITEGVSDQSVGHYQLLATLQQAYGLPRFAETAKVDPISALGG